MLFRCCLRAPVPLPSSLPSLLPSQRVGRLSRAPSSPPFYPLSPSTQLPNGGDVLFVRPDAVFDGKKPISGGIPHCFPQVKGGRVGGSIKACVKNVL